MNCNGKQGVKSCNCVSFPYRSCSAVVGHNFVQTTPLGGRAVSVRTIAFSSNYQTNVLKTWKSHAEAVFTHILTCNLLLSQTQMWTLLTHTGTHRYTCIPYTYVCTWCHLCMHRAMYYTLHISHLCMHAHACTHISTLRQYVHSSRTSQEFRSSSISILSCVLWVAKLCCGDVEGGEGHYVYRQKPAQPDA